MTSQTDTVNWHAHATVEKWSQDQVTWARDRHGLLTPSSAELSAVVAPEETVEWDGNLLCNNGIARLEDLLIGVSSIVGYTNSTARIGVGNGGGTAAAADTDLSASAGSSNRYFQSMDATFPSRSGQTITFKSTFGSADGNFVWAEFGIDGGGASGTTVSTNGSSTAALLNHKTSVALGTKSSGQVWSMSAAILVQ